MGGPGSGPRKGSGGQAKLKANIKKTNGAPVRTVKNLAKSKMFKTKKAGLVAIKTAKRGERYRKKARTDYNSRT